MKVQLNTPKNQSLEEKFNNMNESLGLKIKTQDLEEPQKEISEEVSTEIELDESDIETYISHTSSDEDLEESLDVEDKPVDSFKKVATARLLSNTGTVVYRFDIFYKEYRKDSGIIELRNIVNDFESIRPSNKKDFKDFFAIFGIIRWNFPNTILPVSTNLLAALNRLESLINEHIVIAGIKKGKFEFRVDIL